MELSVWTFVLNVEKVTVQIDQVTCKSYQQFILFITFIYYQQLQDL